MSLVTAYNWLGLFTVLTSILQALFDLLNNELKKLKRLNTVDPLQPRPTLIKQLLKMNEWCINEMKIM